KLYAARFKPGDRISRLEYVEWPKQGLCAAGIVAAEFARIETGVGYVATSAARNAHFRQELRALLQQYHRHIGSGFGASDRRQKTSGATTDHHNAALIHTADNLGIARKGTQCCNIDLAKIPFMLIQKHDE